MGSLCSTSNLMPEPIPRDPDSECCICLNTWGVVNKPDRLVCGHRTCSVCTERIDKCPMCRTPIKSSPQKRLENAVNSGELETADAILVSYPHLSVSFDISKTAPADVLKWMFKNVEYGRHEYMVMAATRHDMDLLEWMRNTNSSVVNLSAFLWMPIPPSMFTRYPLATPLWENYLPERSLQERVDAKKEGDLRVVKWFYEHGACDTDATFKFAVRSDNLDIFKWLHSNGHEMSVNNVEHCVAHKCFDMLEIAVEQKQVANNVCQFSAAYNYMDMLKWGRSKNLEWTDTCKSAAMFGNLDILKWAHEHGAPDDADMGVAAARHLHVVKYLQERGTPLENVLGFANDEVREWCAEM